MVCPCAPKLTRRQGLWGATLLRTTHLGRTSETTLASAAFAGRSTPVSTRDCCEPRIRSIDGGWATRGRFSVARADRTDGHRLTPGLTVAGHGRDPRRGLGIDAGLPAEIRDPSGMVITMYNVSA